MILEGENAARTFDELALDFTGEAPSRVHGGQSRASHAEVQANQVQGCKRSVDVARPAHLGAAVAARPRITEVIRHARQRKAVGCTTTSRTPRRVGRRRNNSLF